MQKPKTIDNFAIVNQIAQPPMTDQNIAIRLKFLIEDVLKITNSQFAENCKISKPTLSQLLSNQQKKVSNIIIGQIHKAYPSLSIMWLLFNEGEIWTDTPPIDSGVPPTENNGNNLKNDGICSSYDTKQNSDEKNLPENSKFQGNGHTDVIESKENGLKWHPDGIENPSGKRVSPNEESPGIINEIINFKASTKKIVQITVYFDDSTFETFLPDGHSQQSGLKD